MAEKICGDSTNEAPTPLEMGAGAIGSRSGNVGQNNEPTAKHEGEGADPATV